MKQTVQPDASQAKKTAEPTCSRPAQQYATASGGHLVQLSKMVNGSPRVQALTQMKEDMQRAAQLKIGIAGTLAHGDRVAGQDNAMEDHGSSAAESPSSSPCGCSSKQEKRPAQKKSNGEEQTAPVQLKVKQARALNESAKVKQRRADGTVVEEGNPGYVMQLKDGIVQRIGFLPGQAKKMIDWLADHGLDQIPVFAGIVARFTANGDLDDNDADAITLLFLTKEAPYREFAEADLAIQFIFVGVHGYGLNRAVTTVSEFSNAYKTFYHLYRRSENFGRPNPIEDVYYGFLGLDAALGDIDAGEISFNSDETGSVPDVHIAMIQNFAENNQLAFSSAESTISHLVKHGTLFNAGTKLTGHEPPQQLQYVYQQYIARANHIIANHASMVTQLPPTLGRSIFSFTLGGEKAIVSFDAATSSAVLTTYFPTEPLSEINDEPALAHSFI